jgi:dephospho-CoA kinase
MFLIGLTGGIAAGKSTVASVWQSLGAHHIDADDLAREAVARGSEGLRQVAVQFGSGVISDDGSLDRSALAAIVFAAPERRAKLEGILHPIIQKLCRERLADAESKLAADAIVVYSIPLLVETDSDLEFDRVVTVEAPESKQIDRMVRVRSMTSADAMKRIEAQATPAQRAQRADYILNSNQAIELLEKDARDLFATLQQQASEKAQRNG